MRFLLILGITLFATIHSYSQTKTKIFWDTSFSMKDKNIERDLGFLESYFKKYQDTEVSLILFNYKIDKEKKYAVSSGDWSKLKSDLSEINYDGATSYSALKSDDGDENIFVFTDGLETMFFSEAKLKGNLYVVNSSPTFDSDKLKYLALTNSGKLLNFAKDFEASNKAKTEKIYSGKLYSDDATIRTVKVSVNGKEHIMINPNLDNTYKINAQPGDSLTFTINNKKRIVKVLGNNNNLNIWLEEDNVRLDEVVVDASIDKEDNDVVTTAYGTQNKEAVGYNVQSVSGEELSEIVTDVSTAVKGKFVSVEYGGSEDISQAVIRGPNSILMNNKALIVVDGTPITSSSSSTFGASLQSTSYLDPNNIADITVLNGLAATNKYGSRGSNGVILITTKTAALSKTNGEQKDLALVQNNIYDEDIKESGIVNIPYVNVLKRVKNVEEAYDVYLNQRNQFFNKPEYFIDIFDFFKSSDTDLAYQILSNVLELEQPTISQLKAAMVRAKESKNYDLSLEVALRTLELFPFRTQSYLDLALAHRDLGNHQNALDVLNKIADGTINPELDFSGIKKIVDAEIKNLIFNYKAQLSLYKTEVAYLKNIEYNARLVFEWSNPEAMFELQFVNPQKRFFNWEYTPVKNEGRFKEGIENGFNVEQFEIFDDGMGEWIINAKSLGNKSKNREPNFLMCTIDYNYGKPNQTTEYYSLRLNVNATSQLIRFKVQ